MKTIILRRLTLEHFKGFEAQTIHFDRSGVSIYGDNASGKTTIYDAYLWLLTGKDSLGRADFEIKPLDSDGNVIDHAAHSSVEAVLDIDGDIITLRREYYERWTKHRGNPDAVFDGHATDFYIDDVPKAKRAYEEAVAEIIPLDILRLLSDLTAFPTMKWQDRRKLLFELAEMESDSELMSQDPKYSPLQTDLGRTNLDEYRAKLKAKRKKISARLNDLPVMIAENRKTEAALGDVPFDRLRASLRDLEEEEHRLTAEIAQDSDAAYGALLNAVQATSLQLDQLEFENQRYRGVQTSPQDNRKQLEQTIVGLQKRLGELVSDYKRQSTAYHDAKKTADGHAYTAEGYRKEWAAENARQWPGALSCPTCGQVLPAQKLAEAKSAWEKEKADKLDRIRVLGESCMNHFKKAEETASHYQENMIQTEAAITQTKDALAEAQAALDGLVAPVIEDMPDYASRKKELEARLHELKQQASDAQGNARARTDSLRVKRQAVRAELESIRGQLAKESALQAIRGRIAELTEERAKLATELEEIDRLTDLADDFIRFKSAHTTKAVNNLFRITQFRLFSEQVNGETPPACDILHGGIPYDGGLNSGARINVGLDIINTLSAHYGYFVPVFVDNAESVTDLLAIDTQIIRLVVSQQYKKVRIEG